MIGYREGGQVVKHVYAFKSQRVKDNWLRTLRFARTKLGKLLVFQAGLTISGNHKSYWLFLIAIASPNGLTWYLSSDQFEEEESVVVHDRRLPLYLSSHRILEVEENNSVSRQLSFVNSLCLALLSYHGSMCGLPSVCVVVCCGTISFGVGYQGHMEKFC